MKKFTFFAIFALFMFACGGGSDSSFNAEKSPYGEPTVTSVAAINAGMLTNEKKLHVLERSGTSEFSGRVFDVIDVKINDSSEAEMLFSPFPVTKETKKIVFGGYTSKSGEGIKPKEAVEVDLPDLGETTEGS